MNLSPESIGRYKARGYKESEQAMGRGWDDLTCILLGALAEQDERIAKLEAAAAFAAKSTSIGPASALTQE